MTPGRFPRGVMKTILVIALSLAGCAAGKEGLSEEEILSQNPVVNRLPGGVEASVMDAADAEAALDRARRALLREEYEQVLSIVRETLAEGPPREIARSLRAIRVEARRGLLGRKVLEARILPERDVCVRGGEIVLELAVRNVSPQAVSVLRRGPGSSVSVFVLDVVRRDFDIYGNVLSFENRVRVPLPEDLRVPVGGRASVTYRMPAGRVEDRHLGFSEVSFGGVLRPAVILCGDERYYSAVKLREAAVRVFPPGYEPIAKDPLGTLATAYRLGAREHLLIAAELAGTFSRPQAVARLVSFLRGPETASWVTVMAALRRLTGRSFGNRAQAWTAWWREEGGHGVE